MNATLLHQLLPLTAARFPDRAAVRFGTQRLTYAELAAQAARLGAALVEAGVKPGDRVGLYFPKSARSVVAMFAVLEAGGIYVPLDPNSPRSRVAGIIADCGIRHLVVTRERLDALLDGPGAPALDAAFLVDAAPHESPAAGAGRPPRVLSWTDVERHPPLTRPAQGSDDGLAYVLYTSGSTGVPKGVMISHRAAFTFVNWTHAEFALREQDVVWNHAPLHFDLSIFDVFTTIKAGGTVVPVPEKLSAFPVRLAQFLRDEAVTVAYTVPSALTMMLLRGNLAGLDLPALRTVLFAGEVFPLKYLREVRRCLRVPMYNLYGPTETNVCTFHEVTDEDVAPDATRPVPIGRAIPGYEVFALTGRGTVAQPGEEGELYGCGPGVMSGYWGDAEKTARVLVPHPLTGALPGPDGGAVKTGDIVIPREDGAFLYVGRRDNMVKVKGYRIELGEVEAALYGHPRITEAAIVPVPDDETGNRLLACVVPDQPGGLTDTDVRSHCAAKLPRYMVPELIEFHAALPKTSTGKVDRPRLLELHRARHGA